MNACQRTGVKTRHGRDGQSHVGAAYDPGRAIVAEFVS